jgi:uncharacterized protein YkwD
MQTRPAGAPWRALVTIIAAVVGVSAATVAATPARAAGFDTGAAEARLYATINRDRADNGLGPLVSSPALSNIARGGSFSACGIVVHGRSQDMIERDYFSHPIPPCGTLVFPALAPLHLSAAGENIGWNNVSPEAASVDQLNAAFMRSAEHRANILGNYNQVGVGAFAAPGGWAYGGRTYSGAVMYTEIFGLGPLPAAPRPAPPRAAVPMSVPTAVAATPVVAGPPAPAPVQPPLRGAQVADRTPAPDPTGRSRYCSVVVQACSQQWLDSLGADRGYYLRGPVELRLAELADALGLLTRSDP